MQKGDKCICQYDDWHNAYGDDDFSVHRGMRLTVSGSINVGGSSFLSFEETPKGNYYLALGFNPLRIYN